MESIMQQVDTLLTGGSISKTPGVLPILPIQHPSAEDVQAILNDNPDRH